MKRHSILFAFLIILGIALTACQPEQGPFSVNDAWVRAAPAGENSAIYFVINNETGGDDTLLSVDCDKARMVELHLSKMDASGKMVMEHQENVPIPAGEQVTFAPGGLHVMLMNLNEDLVDGQEMDITLHFEKAGDIAASAVVRAP